MCDYDYQFILDSCVEQLNCTVLCITPIIIKHITQAHV